MTITRSIVSGNAQAGGPGGGIYDAGSLTIVNSTISANSGSAQGGGIFSWSSGVNLLNATLTANSNPQIYVFGTFTTKNSIINGTTSGTINNLGHNLIGVNPLLGPLQNNGGSTFTHALLSNSPAIDAGDNSGAPATDQRGITRPQNGSVDIGEVQVEFDFGDAGTLYGITMVNNGARHIIRPRLSHGAGHRRRTRWPTGHPRFGR